MNGRFATWFVGIALVAVAGCGGDKEKDKEPATEPSTAKGAEVGKEAGKGSADAPPKRTALTAKSLAPVVIHEIASENVVPTAVVIELASPIIDRQAVGSESPAANLKVTPAIPGVLTHSGISELTFTPSRPFAFDTTYQVELVGVDTVDGTIAPPAGEKWSASFKTPPFKFLGWAPSDIDLDHHKIAMDVAFSGAVLPNAARAGMTFAIDGKPPAGVAMQPSGAGTHAIVVLSDPGIGLGSKLTLQVKDTLASVVGTKAAAASADYIVSSDKAITIK